MAAGRIIFLNGTSSSGTSTLARALQSRLPEPHMHVAIDAFYSMYPERIWNAARQEDHDAFLRLVPTVVSGVQRAAERADRAPGLARHQFERVHAHGVYDLEVDTSVLDVDACVTRIVEGLARDPAQRAFSRLRRRAMHDVPEA